MGRGANNLLYGVPSRNQQSGFDYVWFKRRLAIEEEKRQEINDQWIENTQELFNELRDYDLLTSEAANQLHEHFFDKMNLPFNDYFRLASILGPTPERNRDEEYRAKDFPELFTNIVSNADLKKSKNALEAITYLFRYLIWHEENTNNESLQKLWFQKIIKPGYVQHVYPVRGKAVVHFQAMYPEKGKRPYPGVLCKKNQAIDWNNWGQTTNPSRLRKAKFCQKCLSLIKQPEQKNDLFLRQEKYTDFLIRCSQELGPKIAEQFVADSKQKKQQPLYETVYQSLWQEVVKQVSQSQINSTASNPVFLELSKTNIAHDQVDQQLFEQFEKTKLLVKEDQDLEHYKLQFYDD